MCGGKKARFWLISTVLRFAATRGYRHLTPPASVHSSGSGVDKKKTPLQGPFNVYLLPLIILVTVSLSSRKVNAAISLNALYLSNEVGYR